MTKIYGPNRIMEAVLLNCPRNWMD